MGAVDMASLCVALGLVRYFIGASRCTQVVDVLALCEVKKGGRATCGATPPVNDHAKCHYCKTGSRRVYFNNNNKKVVDLTTLLFVCACSDSFSDAKQRTKHLRSFATVNDHVERRESKKVTVALGRQVVLCSSETRDGLDVESSAGFVVL